MGEETNANVISQNAKEGQMPVPCKRAVPRRGCRGSSRWRWPCSRVAVHIGAGTHLVDLSPPFRNIAIMIAAGIVFTFSLVIVIRLLMDPDSVRARQSDAMLRLASQTLGEHEERHELGEAAQEHLPAAAAFDGRHCGGHYRQGPDPGIFGIRRGQQPGGQLTSAPMPPTPRIADGKMRVLFTAEGHRVPFGAPAPSRPPSSCRWWWGRAWRARSSSTTGVPTISARRRSPSPKGFGQLLSTQMAAARRWKNRRSWPPAWS